MTINKKEAFAKFGIKQKNEVWSWSGINRDAPIPISQNLEAPICVLTIWNDQYDYKAGIWSIFNCNNEIWKDSNGNKARIEDIKYCLSELNGEFKAIFIEPVQRGIYDETRQIKKISINDKLWFRITRFDEETGECEAEHFTLD